MESTISSEEILKEQKLMRDVNNILAGNNFLGCCDIDRYNINPFVVWIGENGQSKSVAEWIRTIWALCVHHENSHPWAIMQGFKWFSCPDFNRPENKNWFFGFKITRDGKEKLVVCGGANDYSGEGGKAKQVGEKFIDMVWPGPISVSSADNLIWALTGGLL